MNGISRRQLYFFLACIAPVGKLVILPSRLAAHTGNDLLFPALMHFILQGAAVFCALLLAKRGMTFYGLLANTFGKIAAKVLILIFAAFLLYAALLPLFEQELFVQGTFYDTLPSVIAFAPFFILAAYLCAKPLYSFGRTWDILGPISCIALLGVFVLSVSNADYAALLPVGGTGVKSIFGGAAKTFSWFFDSALLLPLLGKFEYKKGLAWKGTLFYLLGALGVLVFIATFYGIFQGTAMNQLFAFTETSKYFAAITVLGRVDYLFIYTLALVMIFYVTLPIQGAIECVVQAFGRKNYLPTLLSVGAVGLFFAFTIILDLRFGELTKVISEQLFWIFPIFTIALPPLCLLLRRDRRESA